MSDNEVRELKDYVTQVKEELLKAIADLRVHLAEDYVKKEDLQNYKTDQKWAVGIAATIGGIFVGVVTSIVNYFSSRGGQ